MKQTHITILISLISFLFITCNQTDKPKDHKHKHENIHEENKHASEHDHEHEEKIKETEEHEHDEESHDEFTLTNKQFKALQMKIGKTQESNMGDYIQVNGQLKVPPQNEALITSFIGANVVSIKVIEGEKVYKGQTLAYLSHPEIINKQTEFLKVNNEVAFLKKEHLRQQKLYQAGVASGSSYQKIESQYKQAQTQLKGFEAQLELLNLNTKEIISGEICHQIAVKSPIKGYVQNVFVKMGQYVNPQTPLFEVVNIEQVHADLMVYEKDISKVKKGQKLRFSTQNQPDKVLKASIFSVGKVFEENPKAIHIHATINDKKENLIPGMYIQGKIEIATKMLQTLPKAAIIEELEHHFVFIVKNENDLWHFKKIEIIKGITDADRSAIRFLNKTDENAQFALNNAYYLIAELNKGELEHKH